MTQCPNEIGTLIYLLTKNVSLIWPIFVFSMHLFAIFFSFLFVCFGSEFFLDLFSSHIFVFHVLLFVQGFPHICIVFIFCF